MVFKLKTKFYHPTPQIIINIGLNIMFVNLCRIYISILNCPKTYSGMILLKSNNFTKYIIVKIYSVFG